MKLEKKSRTAYHAILFHFNWISALNEGHVTINMVEYLPASRNPKQQPLKKCMVTIASYIMHHGIAATTPDNIRIGKNICNSLLNLSNIMPVNTEDIKYPMVWALKKYDAWSKLHPVIICRSKRVGPNWPIFRPCNDKFNISRVGIYYEIRDKKSFHFLI